MVFDGPKPLESIEKQTRFLILGDSKNDEKTIPKGTSTVMFWGPKWRHGRPRFDVSFDFWRFAAMPRNYHFLTPSRWTNKSKKSSLGAPRAKRFWKGGPPRDPLHHHHRKRVPEDQASWRPASWRPSFRLRFRDEDSDSEPKIQTQIHRLRFRFRLRLEDSKTARDCFL